MAQDPSLKFGTPAYAAMVREVEILYRGGASADGTLMPALSAIGKIEGIIRSMRAARHA
jgi:hypothetical protein